MMNFGNRFCNKKYSSNYYPTGTNEIVVAVLDTGVQLNHPDLNVITDSSIILKIIARAKPAKRIDFCFSSGSLLVIIEINIILSIPKTISNKVSVSREI